MTGAHGDHMGTDERTAGMRLMWGLADYPGLAQRLDPAAGLLVDRLPAGPGRVLDLAAGTGNVAARLPARGATVTAVDLSPRMVELGRARTGRAAVEWHEADAQDLPFADAAFDAVLSAFGIIFAPRPADAPAQTRRVLTPGGLLALTAWTPQGFMGAMTRFLHEHSPTHRAAADGLGKRAEEMSDAVEQVAGAPDRPVRLDAEYLVVSAH